MPREFKFRKEDARKTKRRESRNFRIEETTVNDEVVHKEISEGDGELAGIHEIAKQVSDDLFDGKITEDEAKRRLSSAVERLTAQGSEFCIVCEKSKENPDSLVCDSCGDDVTVERKVEIHFEHFDDE